MFIEGNRPLAPWESPIRSIWDQHPGTLEGRFANQFWLTLLDLQLGGQFVAAKVESGEIPEVDCLAFPPRNPGSKSLNHFEKTHNPCQKKADSVVPCSAHLLSWAVHLANAGHLELYLNRKEIGLEGALPLSLQVPASFFDPAIA